MELQAYLDRINYRGAVEPTLECLTGVHRQHALTVPYENIDVQLGYALDQDISRIYDKIITRRRGGWCYELNGLLQWALQEIGFDVTRVVAGIHRHDRGDAVLGNHLVLLVRLDGTFIADLGLGDGIREPIPLHPGTHRQGALEFNLENRDDGYWRFHNHSFGYPAKFDFREIPADEMQLEAKCRFLQVSEDSVFVQNLACQIMDLENVTCLTGRVLRHKRADGTEKTLLNSPAELEATLHQVFGIDGVEIAPLWSRVAARHEVLFGDKPIGQIEVKGF
ncbi:MAG: arylamine N-acetyltransferase [Rhizobiales bacterium]|nr:arylamine N-acetyltransferase [Hyphomicrobiales bacterium]